jgi:hypothetical protein
MSKIITFIRPWGEKSWLVEYTGSYSNNRPPHVEVIGYTPVPGQVCSLKNLRKTSRKTLAWEVEDVTNKGEPAHFTVYFGNDPESRLQEYR